MKQECKVQVKLASKDIFEFLLWHSLSTWQGKMTWGLGILALIGTPVMVFGLKNSFSGLVFMIVAVIYLGVTPLSMYSNAKRQMISNSVFKNKIVFTLSEDLLHIKQYTGEVNLPWDKIGKLDQSPHLYLLYVNDKQAFIIPKRFIEEEDRQEIQKLFRDQPAAGQAHKKGLGQDRAEVGQNPPAPTSQKGNGPVEAADEVTLEDRLNDLKLKKINQRMKEKHDPKKQNNRKSKV